MKILFRLSEPVTDGRNQKYILGAALRDVCAGIVLHGGGSLYLPDNPFTFNPEGTAVEAVVAATVPEKNMTKFKQVVIGAMNAEFRANTTKAYSPAADFPKVEVKVMDVENEIQPTR